tara:strand:- start:11882 stop:13600 length:1719 start_codon:yes stop_codon:yes gene_type:complete
MTTKPERATSVFEQVAVSRNLGALARYVGFLVFVILLFSGIFQAIMSQLEGQSHSWTTAIYWTLVTMSTLGFGDIVFESDVGRIFTLVVLLSGTVLLLVVLPFTFIRFFYAPWLETQIRKDAPRSVKPGTAEHVILCRYDEVAKALIERLRANKVPYYVLEPDPIVATRLIDDGISVVTGELDAKLTYEQLNLNDARLLVANHNDTTNANIALTAREVTGNKNINPTPVVGFAEHRDSMDILELAGCNRVLSPKIQLGKYMAERGSTGIDHTDVLGSIKGLRMGEIAARDTSLVGSTIRETALRTKTGASIVGMWQAGTLLPARPETTIQENSILVILGIAEQLRKVEDLLNREQRKTGHPVLIIGGGTVGRAAARKLRENDVSVYLLEKDTNVCDRCIDLADRVIVGDANDSKNLDLAGFREARAVLLTGKDDAVNIYLAVYCRRLRPDVRIVSRVARNRNVNAVHRAGADFAFSDTVLAAESTMALIEGHDMVVLDHSIELFEVDVPRKLVNTRLAESNISSITGLVVVGLDDGEQITTAIDSSVSLQDGQKLVMLGTTEQRKVFVQTFE